MQLSFIRSARAAADSSTKMSLYSSASIAESLIVGRWHRHRTSFVLAITKVRVLKRLLHCSSSHELFASCQLGQSALYLQNYKGLLIGVCASRYH